MGRRKKGDTRPTKAELTARLRELNDAKKDAQRAAEDLKYKNRIPDIEKMIEAAVSVVQVNRIMATARAKL